MIQSDMATGLDGAPKGLQLKTDPDPVATSEFYYDLFDGGYIDPEDQLDPDSAAKVLGAKDIIEQYRDLLESSGLLEEL